MSYDYTKRLPKERGYECGYVDHRVCIYTRYPQRLQWLEGFREGYFDAYGVYPDTDGFPLH